MSYASGEDLQSPSRPTQAWPGPGVASPGSGWKQPGLCLPHRGSARWAGLRVWLRTTTVIPETPAKAGVPPPWVDGIPGWVWFQDSVKSQRIINVWFLALFTKTLISFSRQGSPGRDEYYLHPAHILELGRLCPSRALWTGGVHSLHDPHSSPRRVPRHRVSAPWPPWAYVRGYLPWTWLECYSSKFSGQLASCYLVELSSLGLVYRIISV